MTSTQASVCLPPCPNSYNEIKGIKGAMFVPLSYIAGFPSYCIAEWIPVESKVFPTRMFQSYFTEEENNSRKLFNEKTVSKIEKIIKWYKFL